MEHHDQKQLMEGRVVLMDPEGVAIMLVLEWHQTDNNTCRKMNKTAKYYGKWNNTGREQQISHVLPPKISNKSWN